MYGGYFDEQIAKQARTAISRAVSAGKRNMEVQFPSVPNVEEAKFGTPLNKKFGEKGKSFPFVCWVIFFQYYAKLCSLVSLIVN